MARAPRRSVIRSATAIAHAFAREPSGEADEQAEELWEHLWQGGWEVQLTVDDAGRRILLLKRRPGQTRPPTPHELEALRLAARGKSLKEIASKLNVAASTVATHLQRGLEKVGFRDRVQLGRLCGEREIAP